MNKHSEPFVDIDQARAFLTLYLGAPPAALTFVGEGAWSRCFGFRRGAEALVIRFGRHGDDFEKDRLAHAYAAPGLPIPRVDDIGRAYGGYYAVSTRAFGLPLEQLSSPAWLAALPSVAAMLEALRLAPIPTTAGAGGWDARPRAAHDHWSRFLLAVGADTPERRTHGWRALLATSPAGSSAFEWGYDRLREAVSDDLPLSLVHADLLNRNVLVDGAAIGGVFDWGCSLYGDHLFDLAWLVFWSPWHPQLDLRPLWEELARRWQLAGYAPANLARRLTACYLQIGLDHLAYHAWCKDWAEVENTARRMRALVDQGDEGATAILAQPSPRGASNAPGPPQQGT